jgi:hypothetical protein
LAVLDVAGLVFFALGSCLTIAIAIAAGLRDPKPEGEAAMSNKAGMRQSVPVVEGVVPEGMSQPDFGKSFNGAARMRQPLPVAPVVPEAPATTSSSPPTIPADAHAPAVEQGKAGKPP